MPRADRNVIAATVPAESLSVDPAVNPAAHHAVASDVVPFPAAGTDWSGAELAVVRVDLVADLAQLQRDYEQSVEEVNVLQFSNTDGAGDDQADAGSRTFDREQNLSIAANRLDLISQLTQAIDRVDRGRYGRCDACGKDIPRARLEAFPMATLDVACKQREERR